MVHCGLGGMRLVAISIGHVVSTLARAQKMEALATSVLSVTDNKE